LPTNILRPSILALSLSTLLAGCQLPPGVTAASSDTGRTAHPSFMVTNTPAPEVVYKPGSRDDVESKRDWEMARTPMNGMGSRVADKVTQIETDLATAHGAVETLRSRLADLQWKNDALASDYYTFVAGINTGLQSGTTAGNPVLTERWNRAKAKLDDLAQAAGGLNTLANDVANEASKLSYIQTDVRAAFTISGALEEDHKRLHAAEDRADQDVVSVNHLLTAVNDEINRRDAYVRAERLNMQTLAAAVANGELYGQSVVNNLYRKAADDVPEVFTKGASAVQPQARRPLVIIRFDRPNVDFKQPVYTAVSQALEKYPAAQFDLVAVSAAEGNPARLALAATDARKNGEAVLRALTQMGVPAERVTLSAATSRDVTNSEVHLYIR
jgi:hypothetical protein